MEVLLSFLLQKTKKVSGTKQPRLSDEELWQEYSGGNGEAFRELYQRHHQRIILYILRFVGSREEAEDIFQETWVRFAGLKGKKNITNADFFLMRVARNLITDAHRKNVNLEIVEIDEGMVWDGQDPLRKLQGAEIEHAVSNAVLRLPPIYREVFILREYEGYEYDQIALLTNVSENTVRVRYHRSLEYIGRMLQKWMGLNEEGYMRELS